MAVGADTSITAIILLYFVISTIIVFWRHKPVIKQPEIEDAQEDGNGAGDVQNALADVKEPEKPPQQTRLKKTIICAVLFTISLSIAEATVRGIYIGGLRKDVDDSLLADLLFIFSWTVLLLSLNTSKLNYAHHGSFALSFLVRASLLADVVSRSGQYVRQDDTLRKTLIALIGSQMLSTVATFAITVTSSCLPVQKKESSPETEPLLGNKSDEESQKAKNGTAKKPKSEDDKARDALRDRPGMQYLNSFRILIPFMWPSTIRQKAHIIGMIICSALERVLGILQPLALGAVINDLAQTSSVPWKSISVYILLRVLGSNIGVSLVEEMLYIYLQNMQELAMKRAVYDHILNLSANFHDAKSTSNVWQAMYHARSAIALIHDAAFSIGPSVIDLAAGFVVLYVLFGDYMGLLVLATCVLFLWMTANALSPRADLYRKHEDCWYDETFQMYDSTQNWYTVAEFNQIPHEKEQFRRKGEASQEITISIWWYNRLSSMTRYSVIMLAFMGACCIAAVQIANHEQKIGAFVTLTAYWAQLTGPLTQLVNEINSASEKLVKAEKLLVLLEKKPEIKDADDAKPFSFRGGAVEFENVHFTYDGKRQASEGITFRAPPGSTTALVGETGGGKSTILKLLFRFYDPQAGKVSIDGQDLKDLQASTFRKHIGWVPQDAAPFNKTILDNVRYSDPALEEKEVEEACKDAALHDKIMTFTKKYEEKVGERGTKLSGGERQRMAIARAIIKNPDILLLDEATSSVDSVTEAQIQASLDKLGKTKTTFIIAHRLSTILKADQILVIEKGKLVECGKHANLIQQDGTYRKLWESQLKLQADIGEQGELNSETPKQDITLVDDIVNKESDSKSGDEERGRKSTSMALKPIGQQTSSFQSSRPNSREITIDSKVHGNANISMSPSRSRLKPDAAAFVPKNIQVTNQDGTSGLKDSDADPQTCDGHDRRLTKSEPLPNEDDAQATDDNDSEVGDAVTPKHSRIPKRS